MRAARVILLAMLGPPSSAKMLRSAALICVAVLRLRVVALSVSYPLGDLLGGHAQAHVQLARLHAVPTRGNRRRARISRQRAVGGAPMHGEREEGGN